MAANALSTDISAAATLRRLERLAAAAAPADGAAWLAAKLAAVRAPEPAGFRALALAFSQAPRRVGRAPLRPEADDVAFLAAAAPGFSLEGFGTAEAARTALLIAYAEGGEARFLRALAAIRGCAELLETVALGRALPLLPYGPSLVPEARELLRMTARAPFEAVAHRNPYPARHFDEDAWCHMVLKALFVGAALHPIQGLDARACPRLARMLLDFAHERLAAARPVPAELWRCVGPFADAAALADLGRALGSQDRATRHAAMRAVHACPLPAARALEHAHPDLAGPLLEWPEIAAAGAS